MSSGRGSAGGRVARIGVCVVCGVKRPISKAGVCWGACRNTAAAAPRQLSRPDRAAKTPPCPGCGRPCRRGRNDGLCWECARRAGEGYPCLGGCGATVGGPATTCPACRRKVSFRHGEACQGDCHTRPPDMEERLRNYEERAALRQPVATGRGYS